MKCVFRDNSAKGSFWRFILIRKRSPRQREMVFLYQLPLAPLPTRCQQVAPSCKMELTVFSLRRSRPTVFLSGPFVCPRTQKSPSKYTLKLFLALVKVPKQWLCQLWWTAKFQLRNRRRSLDYQIVVRNQVYSFNIILSPLTKRKNVQNAHLDATP
jgi:hypothetical protein